MKSKTEFGILALLLSITVILFGCSQEQESSMELKQYYNSVVKELSSVKYNGRSQFGDGDIMAAAYIIDNLIKCGAEPVDVQNKEYVAAYPEKKSKVMPCDGGRWIGREEHFLPYLQHFSYPMNVMRGNISLSVDGSALEPTVDYIVKEFSPSCSGKFRIETLDEKYYNPEAFIAYANSGRFEKSFILIDWNLFREKMPADSVEIYLKYFSQLERVGGFILKQQEQFPYFKARSYYTTPMPVIMVNGSFPDMAKELEIVVESEMIEKHDAHNIFATIKGKGESGKRILFMAHYDHLGFMGCDNMFAGANDNASGVAMLLSLAEFYANNTPDYTVDFLFLDGEEANLLGAFYYTENPAVPLESIDYAVNIDMVGDTGDTLKCEISEEGRKGLELFRNLNSKSAAPFHAVECNPLTDNSDHYAFALKGVPVIYFTVEGDYYDHYHTPRDIFENTSDMNFERIFNLLVSFAGVYGH